MPLASLSWSLGTTVAVVDLLLPAGVKRLLRRAEHWAVLIVRTLHARRPQPLVQSTFVIPPGTYAALDLGVDERQLQPRPREPRAGSHARHPVFYARSGVILEVDEQSTLLEAALDAGLELTSACRMGLCGTCKARLLDGQISMPEPNALTDEERAQGYCLPCISRPRGPVKLDA